MIIGEAPGEQEGLAGLPFRPSAPAGKILEKAIRRLGYQREQFWVTNIVDRRPPHNWLENAPWEEEMISFCLPRLREDITRLGPKCIVALGGTALRVLTGMSGGKKSVTYLRGYALPSIVGVPVVSSFHPSYLARGQSRLLGLLMRDISTAIAIAQGRGGVVNNPREIMDCLTGLDHLENLLRESEDEKLLRIAYDIETQTSAEGDEDAILESETESDESDGGDGVYEEENRDLASGSEDPSHLSGSPLPAALDVRRAEIRTVQFSLNPRWGVSVSYIGEFIPIIKKILALPNPKAGHNSTWFDRPVLANHGVKVEGREDDTMVMWRCLQPDLPAHLQAVAGAHGWLFPWKHMAGSDIEFYGVADVCAVQKIMEIIPDELKRLGIWEWYDTFTREFNETVILPMCKRGLPISKDKLFKLREWLNVEITRMEQEIQVLAPESLKGWDPPKGYKNMPPELKEFVKGCHPEFTEPIPRLTKQGLPMVSKETGEALFKSNPIKISEIYRLMVEAKGGPALAETFELVKQKWPEFELKTFEGELRLAKRLPFNTRSSLQMLAYLKLKGYPIPTRFKDGKETTSDKEMQRLEEQTKDPLIKLSRSMRAYAKLRDSYVGKDTPTGPEGGWIPEADGRLRSIITFKSTGQLAASPNTMTLPKRRPELAQKFRECLEAEPGHVYLAFDYSNFHGLTTALEARDKQMYRLAAIDVHSFVAGHMVRFPGIDTCLSLSDPDLAEYLSEIKKKHKPVREFQAKPAVHGTNFGQGYRRLYFEYREHFSSETAAKRLLDLLRSLFPRVFAWQVEVCDLADQQGYLQSRWGARRWFWDVYNWKKNYQGHWVKENGKDAEKAKAFLPANDAHGMLRYKLLGLDKQGLLDKLGLVNIVHDEILFHCPKVYLDEAIPTIGRFLEEPVARLADEVMCPEGFVCKVEASFGPNRGEMKEVKF